MTSTHAYVWPGPATTPAPADAALQATRRADAADAPAIHALIMSNLAEGHLLPRTLGNVTALADRFAVVERGGVVLACGELAPLSTGVAEVRSLVVHPDARGLGLGRVIIDDLRRRARAGRFRTLCAFTHGPRFFVRLGFSIVPHAWLPEKVASDCWSCTRFPHCTQYAMVIPAAGPASPSVLAHGRTS
ncbi:MAG: GNAT family N-acetyltransferase [Vicinamibacterales bacterium]|nr:GNAT family N-acetyltransferase [Vicinamibacterales bacterium]